MNYLKDFPEFMFESASVIFKQGDAYMCKKNDGLKSPRYVYILSVINEESIAALVVDSKGVEDPQLSNQDLNYDKNGIRLISSKVNDLFDFRKITKEQIPNHSVLIPKAEKEYDDLLKKDPLDIPQTTGKLLRKGYEWRMVNGRKVATHTGR